MAIVPSFVPFGAGLKSRLTTGICCSLLTPPLRSFTSGTAPTLARLVPLDVKISRKAAARNQTKMDGWRKKLGPKKYAAIGRDHRRSPITERRCSTTPTQPTLAPLLPIRILPFLAGKHLEGSGQQPLDIVPGSLTKTLEKCKTTVDATAAANSSKDVGKSAKDLLRMPSRAVIEGSKDKKSLANSSTYLSLPASHAPTTTIQSPASPTESTSIGPYYAFGLKPSEVQYLFKHLPKQELKKICASEEDRLAMEERLEVARRLLSLENGSSAMHTKFNVNRCVEIFARKANDCGSAEVQAAVMSVRILGMKGHLKANPKDMNTKRQLIVLEGKRKRMLKYLKGQNIEKYVRTCLAFGLDPASIRAQRVVK